MLELQRATPLMPALVPATGADTIRPVTSRRIRRNETQSVKSTNDMATRLSQEEIDEKEWQNPDSWTLGLFYYSEKDSRLWVPKRGLLMRSRHGGTPNFAKPGARSHFMILVGIGALVVLVVVALDRMGVLGGR